jgi:hypothetical protein
MIAFLKRIDEFTVGDFDLPTEDYMRLLNAQHDQIPVVVLGVGCEVDGKFEHDYHDIEVEGVEYQAISGYHLTLARTIVQDALDKVMKGTLRYGPISINSDGSFHCGNGLMTTEGDKLQKILGSKFNVTNRFGYVNITLNA